ncbi:hypothetical protein C8F04DRAFT_1249010 [Mycena alexandri]|uniref:Uncharacterized protein n=1 Tax=Mycena alexandri TaxID=1745969 RepID=A0AAD6TFG6_9AGAR|nr:hypothetical protein C8F04DRAFT_1249010 [Mycena alexandri]
MDGSDDYFFDDDIILDDQTLAVLDSEEQKYLSQAPPPAKRQKTDKGWKPVAIQGRAPVVDEDLPEISVHGDGSYVFRGPPRIGGSNSTGIAPATRQPPIPHQRVASVPVASRVPTHTRPPEPPARPRDPAPQAATHARVQAPPRREPPPAVASDISQAQGEALRKQIEELRRENEKYRAELKDATDAKLAKQGEVSILRQTIEKGAQDHATQVAKLKVAKEESEARQIALQKEMKVEMERLKTQFIFKQHELESSSRKPPASVRSKRVAKDIPSTPLAVPSQIRGWNATASHAGFPDQSPVRARGSPQGANARRTPEKLRKPPKLMGFQNSFADATPIRSVQSRTKKVTDRSESVVPGRETSPSTSPIPFPQQFTDVKMTDFADELSGPEATDAERPADEVMLLDDLQEIAPFNWKAELTRIILTHSSPQGTSPTLKILVGLTLPAPELAEQYSIAVTRVLELVASTSQHKDYETALSSLCRYLTSMLAILNGTDLVHELAVLLNLLTYLSCSLPIFAPSLLAVSHENGDDCDILETLCSIVRDHLDPTNHKHTSLALGSETIGLLDSLCWNVKDDLISRLAVLCNSKDILMILLDTSQPSWFLRRSTQLLVFLATHPKLSRDLLSSSEKPLLSDGGKAKDVTKVPHIERMCSILIDASRRDSDAVEMKSQILTFFGILSVAHPDVHALLVGCQGLVPSLVAFLTQMTRLLWEGDEFFSINSEAIAKTIRTLNQTLFLLHHLVFGIEPNFNLRHRLHYAPSRTFNGITHMFIVTFGRLGCADPPEWIESTHKLELESVSEMAQDLLDLVVDGPEGDSIWTAYQVDPGDTGDNSDTDEEDMEARLLGT